MTTFQDKVKALRAHHEELLSRKNEPVGVMLGKNSMANYLPLKSI